jgi:hypothetical protein
MEFLKEWSSVLEWLKRPYVPFSATLVLYALLYSNETLESFGLGGARPFVAVLFLLCACILLAQILANSCAAISRWNQRRVVAKKYRERLDQLTDDEKLILKRYIDGKTRAQNLDRFDGVVICLEDAGIIYRGSDATPMFGVFPYIITDFAWDYLNKNPGKLTCL